MRPRPRCEAAERLMGISLSVPIVIYVQKPPRQASWHGPKQHCSTCAPFGKLAKPPNLRTLSACTRRSFAHEDPAARPPFLPAGAAG